MILKKLSERFGIAGEMLKTLERRLLKAVMKAEAKYWIPRVVEQEREFNHAAEEFAKIISAPILRSGNTLTEKLERIYTNFQSAFDLSDEEAKKIIDQAETDRSFTDIIKATAENMSEGEAKQRALAEISAPAYKYRIEQTENLLKNEKEMLEGLARGEIRAETEFFQTEAEKAMSITVENVSVAREAAAEAVRGELGIHVRSETEKAVEEAFAKQEQGVYSSFNFISRERVDKIVNTDWSGRHFSERIWRNTEKLSSEIKDIMLHAELTGESFSKISADLQKKYGVRAYESLRLIKTETNYITNQAELDDLKARGVEQYELVAKLDDVTSKICEAMDGNVYNVAEAVVGVNYPPFHPNCRTRAFGHIGEQQAAEDLEDIVDGMDFDEMEKYLEEQGMTWDEWLEKDMEQIREEQKNAENEKFVSADMSGENSQKALTTTGNGDIIESKTDEVSKRPQNEPDYLKQFDRFDTSTRTDKEMLAQINPNDEHDNCVRCVTAYELVRQGYDVTALPLDKNDPVDQNITKLWDLSQIQKNDGFITPSLKTFKKDVIDAFDKWGDGSRAIIGVFYKNGGGHALCAEKIGDKIIYRCPQTNNPNVVMNVLLDDVRSKQPGFVIRVDNATPTPLVTYAVKNRSEIL